MSSPSASDTSPVPVGRLAPSPTGLLHLGHARTFLLAWWSVRSRNGRILLRFDDLDEQRARPELAAIAQADLEWLGLDWDGAPSWQSKHQERFTDAIRQLTERGACYACVCSRRDVEEAIAAPHQGQAEPRYPGLCRDRFPSLEQAQIQTGKQGSLRFRVPSGLVSFEDKACGSQLIDVEGTIGDFVVVRRDGSPAYQLAVVVDDAAEGITEVVRGMDLLASTARQFLLQDALGLAHPRWAHAPLVEDAEGRRLAKRADSVSLKALREANVDPRAVIGWAATTLGLTAPSRCQASDLLASFSWSRVCQNPTVLGADPLSELLATRG